MAYRKPPMFAIADNLKYIDLHLLWPNGTGVKLSNYLLDPLSSRDTKYSQLHLVAMPRSYEDPFNRSPNQVLKHKTNKSAKTKTSKAKIVFLKEIASLPHSPFDRSSLLSFYESCSSKKSTQTLEAFLVSYMEL